MVTLFGAEEVEQVIVGAATGRERSVSENPWGRGTRITEWSAVRAGHLSYTTIYIPADSNCTTRNNNGNAKLGHKY
jgi:hypothetical protein